MIKISQIEINKNVFEECPECGGKIILNSYEKVCKDCGLVVNMLFKESSFIFNDIKNKNNLSKQYVALGERTDFIGGLGSFIDYENSKCLPRR